MGPKYQIFLSLSLLSPFALSARLIGTLPLNEAPAAFISDTDHAELGDSVAFVGDINGDGFDDFLLGAYINGDAGFQTGKVYLMMGQAGGFDGTFSLEDTAHAIFIGEGSSNYAGSSVAPAGDLDDDGYDDFLIGARGAQIDAGWTYLYYGHPTFPMGNLDLGDADAVFKGKGSGDSSGIALGGIGDINGDGLRDMAFGAPKEDQGARNSGAVHIFFGRKDRFSGSYSVLLSDATLRGEAAGDEFGTSISGGFDVDGDGYADIAVGAPKADPLARPDAGAVYLFLGGPAFPSGEIATQTAEITIAGEETQHYLGWSIDLSPDVTGDGRCEILTGAIRHSGAGNNAGMAYLIPGQAQGTWPLSTLSAEAFDAFSGEAEQDSAGTAVVALGDVDGDGLGDIAFSAPLTDATTYNNGRVSLYYADIPWPGFNVLSNAPLKFEGQLAGQLAGTALGGQGDTDGDSYPDLLIGSSSLGQVHLLQMGRYIDLDKDGQRAVDGDCDDEDPSIGSGFPEICQEEGEDPIDNDCDTHIDEGCGDSTLFPTPTPPEPPTPTETPDGSPTASPTASSTGSLSPDPSETQTQLQTHTATATLTATATSTEITPTDATVTPSQALTPSQTPSPTASPTPRTTETTIPVATPSDSTPVSSPTEPLLSPTNSATPSRNPTPENTPSFRTPTPPQPTATPTQTPTGPTNTEGETPTPLQPTASPTPISTQNPTSAPTSPNVSPPPSVSPPNKTPTVIASPTPTEEIPSLSATPTGLTTGVNDVIFAPIPPPGAPNPNLGLSTPTQESTPTQTSEDGTSEGAGSGSSGSGFSAFQGSKVGCGCSSSSPQQNEAAGWFLLLFGSLMRATQRKQS